MNNVAVQPENEEVQAHLQAAEAEKVLPIRPLVNALTDAKPEVDLETFAKLDIRIGKVRFADYIEGSDRLLTLQVDIGTEIRQVVAGIKHRYSPEDLIGQRVVLLCNLKPTRLRGVVSHGMVLAAVEGDHLSLLTTADKAPRGAKVR